MVSEMILLDLLTNILDSSDFKLGALFPLKVQAITALLPDKASFEANQIALPPLFIKLQLLKLQFWMPVFGTTAPSCL